MKTTNLLLLSLLTLLGFTAAMAQVSINNPSPHPASILDLSAPGQQDKGVKLPKGQLKNLDVTKVNGKGMMMLDTTTNSLYVYDGADWQKINVFTAASTPQIDTVATPVATTTSKVEIQNDLTVSGKLNVAGYAENALVPSGGIIMWSGSTNAIPFGWQLCDGTNSTPDLRERFIVGAGGDNTSQPVVGTNGYTTNNIGGSNTVTLSKSNIPAHVHNSGSLNTNPAGSGSYVASPRLEIKGINASNGGTQAFTENSQNKSTQITVNINDHIHPIAGNTGDGTADGLTGTAHENRPPYYALAFIMKLP